jgi:hypothetical protein
MASACCDPITKRASRARAGSGGALGNGGGIIQVCGVVVANTPHLLTAEAVTDIMRLALGDAV